MNERDSRKMRIDEHFLFPFLLGDVSFFAVGLWLLWCLFYWLLMMYLKLSFWRRLFGGLRPTDTSHAILNVRASYARTQQSSSTFVGVHRWAALTIFWLRFAIRQKLPVVSVFQKQNKKIKTHTQENLRNQKRGKIYYYYLFLLENLSFINHKDHLHFTSPLLPLGLQIITQQTQENSLHLNWTKKNAWNWNRIRVPFWFLPWCCRWKMSRTWTIIWESRQTCNKNYHMIARTLFQLLEFIG